jgi:predicted dehydrogenase
LFQVTKRLRALVNINLHQTNSIINILPRGASETQFVHHGFLVRHYCKASVEAPAFCHRQYSIVLVGLGHRGYNTFFRCLKASSFNVLAVCDTDPGKFLTFSQSHPDVPAYSSIEGMLADHKPDFAIVCVPHQFHKDCVDILADGGVPILKEKPVAGSAEDFRKLVCAPIKIGVAMQKRFEPRYNQFKSLLSSVGEIASIQARIVLNIRDLASSWRASRGVGVTICTTLTLFAHHLKLM